jgi:hypothetical protein
VAPLLASLGDISANSYGFFSAPAINPNAKFYSLATATVDSGGASSITFGAGGTIPQTYTHLQVRGIARSDYAANSTGPMIPYLNNDTNSANYYSHRLLGENSSVYAQSDNATGGMLMLAGQMPLANIASNIFGAVVLDIEDYANTNKFKTLRGLGGVDTNGGGSTDISLGSGLYQSYNAINQITLYLNAGNFVQYSQLSLYGVK